MLHNPYKIVKMFEEEVAHYTGAPYAVSVNSCTNALFLACKWYKVEGKEVIIPKRTYLSPPQSIIQAGGKLVFEDIEWKGIYQLKPFPIYDAAKRLTSNMYIPGTMMCLSFHIKKHLKIGKLYFLENSFVVIYPFGGFSLFCSLKYESNKSDFLPPNSFQSFL